MHPSHFSNDLHSASERIRSGQATASELMQECLAVARSPVCAHVFRRLNVNALAVTSPPNKNGPLSGLAVSVKDLFDVAGEVTASGGHILCDRPAAAADAVAVARLKAAGGVVIGRTNMVEFAFSGVGVNPHFGTPVNPQALRVDPRQPRIPGGSSSGAAVSVASGAAFVGLGSDTGGSLRIPAALCGLVGYKPSASSVPTDGSIQLSHSLDSVGAITRSVRDAVLVHEILSSQPIQAAVKPLSACRFLVSTTLMQDGLDGQVAQNFERSIKHVTNCGAQLVERPLKELGELSSFQIGGGLVAAELHAWLVREKLWPKHQSDMDPRVAARIALANDMRAADYIELQARRRRWIRALKAKLHGFDGVLSPTVPIVAPAIAQVAPGSERDADFLRTNALLLRNTSVVNLLDGCAISLPNHPIGRLPTGLMLWHHHSMDARVLQIARQLECVIH